jgi:hypothetical protein
MRRATARTSKRPNMPSADYFRRQAEICVRLSALAKNKELLD